MVTFNDGYKINCDDMRQAILTAVVAMMPVLPKRAKRMDVVKAVLSEGSKILDTLPMEFFDYKE